MMASLAGRKGRGMIFFQNLTLIEVAFIRVQTIKPLYNQVIQSKRMSGSRQVRNNPYFVHPNLTAMIAHMTSTLRMLLLLISSLISSSVAYGQLQQIKPVTPNASPEAVALLQYFHDISGKGTLSGQHNFPISGDRNSKFAADYIGKTPVVWSQDFGFAAAGDKDSYLARPDIIREAIRQHKLGSIVTLCWHAAPPTASEPVTFQPLPGYDSTALASVQGKLLDKQFKDLLTPGTRIYKQWIKQVDEIAGYLKQLSDAKVPVLWRPYHEMNGDWFWWGGRYEGKYTTAALYRQIFDRLVKHHKLNNLIWVWSVDRPSKAGREFVNYYPGNQYLDMLAIDIYGNDFNQSYYDGLMNLSQGKPVTLGEVGNPPAPEILKAQPNWVYWVVWSGMVRLTSRADYEKVVNDPRAIFKEDEFFINSINKFRAACGLSELSTDRSIDLSGQWELNEYESDLGNSGPGAPPYKLGIVQRDNELEITSTSLVEWADDEVSVQTLTLDGTENNSKVFGASPRTQRLSWSPAKDTLTIDSRTVFNFGTRVEVVSQETWTVKRMGRRLEIQRMTQSPNGSRSARIVYDRK